MGDGNIESPTGHAKIIDFLKTTKSKAGKTLNPTEDYDLEEYLLPMMNFIRGMPGKNEAERAQIASWTLHRQCHALRAMSLSNMAPKVKHLRIPPKSETRFWCGDIPLVIAIGYDQVNALPYFCSERRKSSFLFAASKAGQHLDPRSRYKVQASLGESRKPISLPYFRFHVPPYFVWRP
jgi:hypothetical protein